MCRTNYKMVDRLIGKDCFEQSGAPQNLVSMSGRVQVLGKGGHQLFPVGVGSNQRAEGIGFGITKF